MSRRLLYLALTFFCVLIWIYPAQAAEDVENESAFMVQELMELIHIYHLSNPEPSDLMEGAINGMIDTLDDPYAEYFSPEELQGFTDELNGDLVGIGIEINAGEQYPLVVRVLPGTPAEKGGLKAGDLIIAVDGESTADQGLSAVVTKIRGPLGSQVALTVRRGEKELDFIIHRADIHVPMVEHEMLSGNTGYINISGFGSRTAKEFDSALQDLKTAGIESLIIDLRFNGGGYMYEAVDIADNFIAKDSVVINIVNGQGESDEVRTTENPSAMGIPLVVLVNPLSASASEILAGALQDYGIASLVGTRTYGKGVMQSIIPLSSGGALKLTVAKYMTPAGNDIDNIGLTPNHYVLTHGLQKEIAWQILHPEDDPDLVFVPGTDKSLFNGFEIDLEIKTLNRGNEIYLPLRAVLESMLYQVHWEDNIIKVFSDQQEILTINTVKDMQNSESGVFMDNEISFISEKFLSQLNIDIDKDGNKIVISRGL